MAGTNWFTRSGSGPSSSLTLPSFEVSHSKRANMKCDTEMGDFPRQDESPNLERLRHEILDFVTALFMGNLPFSGHSTVCYRPEDCYTGPFTLCKIVHCTV